MQGIKPYIAFKGNCKEAIEFYKQALGAEVLFTQTYGDSPMKGRAPDDKIMHCTIKVGDSMIMACDNMFEENPTIVGNNISLAIGGKDVGEIESTFEKMSDGATVTMPLQETFWAERFGMLTDKFGINWMFDVDKPEADHAQAGA